MRKQIVTALAGVGIALAVAAQPARASLPATACSSAALQVCAAVSASTFQATTTSTVCTGHGPNQVCGPVTTTSWHLVLKVWNLYGLQGLSNVITYVGMGSKNYTGTSSLAGAKYNGSAITTWQNANSFPQNAVGAQLDLAGQTKNGVTNGLVGCGVPTPPGYATCYPSGAYLELDFLTSSQFDLNDPTAVYGWHAQDVNNGDCSLWVDSNGQTVSQSGTQCGNVVPEPITMVLLGSGLAGMGGVGAIRRRRKDGDVESA
jgi:hypothetical protein